MNHHYEDIRSRISEEPRWWDEHAVPRYCDFKPTEVADIHADEAVLIVIACQSCGHRFKVALTSSRWSRLDLTTKRSRPKLSEYPVGEVGWGDPPNIDCCGAGPTMTSDTVGVLEFWELQDFEWTRRPDLEGVAA